jgi:hypothetical protein
VLDYKTGKDLRGFKTIDELFDRETKDRNKAAMQVLLYSLMYKNTPEVPEGTLLQPALYNSKELYSKGFNAKLSVEGQEIDALSSCEEKKVNEKLQDLLTSIVAGTKELAQREDAKGCEYCAYTAICGR